MKKVQNSFKRQHKQTQVLKPLLAATVIAVRLRAGQEEKLKAKLKEICREQKHRIPGTVERYVMQNMARPDEIQIMLIWQEGMEPFEQDKALQSLFADLDDVLDWQTASTGYYHRVLSIISENASSENMQEKDE